MKSRCVLLPLVFALAALVGCANPAGGAPKKDGGTGDGGGEAQADNLFVLNATTGSYDFATASADYLGPDGYTLWSLSLGAQSTFVGRDVTLRKDSGYQYAGYGIVFCERALGDGSETMLVAMINTEGQYSVGEAAGSTYTPYTGTADNSWVNANASSAVLHVGYGEGNANELVVTRDAASKEFTLSLNGHEVFSFTDQRLPLVEGGSDGFIAVIGPDSKEDFPSKPVQISYTEH